MGETHINYNKEKVSALIKKAQGEKKDRTIRQYAMDAGVSPASIVRICKGDNYASPETLRKLTSDKAKPRGGVTFEELMAAAGYINLNWDYYDSVNNINYENTGVGDVEHLRTYVNEKEMPLQSEGTTDTRAVRTQNIAKYKTQCMGIIHRTLSEKGLKFSNINQRELPLRYCPEMAIKVENGLSENKIKEETWFYLFLPSLGDTDEKIKTRVRGHLGQMIFIKPNPDYKVTVLVDSELAFNYLIGYKGELAYRGNLSVAYLDIEALSIIKEEDIAHYK